MILSVELAPVSLAAVKSGVPGAASGVVSMVNVVPVGAPLVLPAASAVADKLTVAVPST